MHMKDSSRFPPFSYLIVVDGEASVGSPETDDRLGDKESEGETK
eukprot:SAG11_NODE_5921_length_1432_cov_2.393848_3_plen_44_part_00